MKTLLQFGAGNIGRSFLGQIFSRAGYEVVFVDIDERLIEALNHEKRYRLVIKHPDREAETIWIENVRAVDGRDTEAVAREIASADIAGTSVGQRAMPIILKTLARGLLLRHQQHGIRPLDIIIAENLHNAAEYYAAQLRKHLGDDFPQEKMTGLIETSIGKMVPIMRPEDLQKDPVWVFAEPYNELILDARAFKHPIPDVPGLAPMHNMAAYVDRKLYIHNLGHASTAYLGFQKHPEAVYIYQVLEDPEVAGTVRAAMMQSAEGLLREYPDAFTRDDLEAHVDDLLARFANRALGDTVFRVGRDLPRKLARQDRLVGAMLLCEKHGLPYDHIARAYVAGTLFAAPDGSGNPDPEDKSLAQKREQGGIEDILASVSGLTQERALDQAVRNVVLGHA